MKHQNIKNLTLAAVFTAIVFLFTAYLHIPTHTGYTHVGDGFIYLAACLLPLPYGIFVGAGGALLADCLTGFAIWAPASVIIKGLTVLLFTRNGKKIISTKNLLALIPAGILCVGGYYLYEALITQNFIAPLAGIPGYVIQWVLSSILFLALGLSADRLNIKKNFNGGSSL